METLEFNGRTFDAHGRNGFYRQTAIEAMVRRPNYGESGANKGEPPPADATQVVQLAGHHKQGLATGCLCIPFDQLPEFIAMLQKLKPER